MNNAQKFKKEETIKMFLNLKKHIGENIICKAFYLGMPYDIQGELKEIYFFQRIIIGDANGNTNAPFIGYNFAISKIILAETNEELYNNPYIKYGYGTYGIKNTEDLKMKMYGSTKVLNKRLTKTIK